MNGIARLPCPGSTDGLISSPVRPLPGASPSMPYRSESDAA
ncbi:hypothetical protein ACVWXU_007026 [Streptomyces sp. TE33382]